VTFVVKGGENLIHILTNLRFHVERLNVEIEELKMALGAHSSCTLSL